MRFMPFYSFFLIIFINSGNAQAVKPAEITIVRDTFGIPHIFAATDAEVAYGLAWAHCEDDFEHIQMMMITTQARLGELNGKDGAISDYFVRFIKAKEIAETKYETDLSREYKNILQAYADGLNSYAEKHPAEIELKGIFPVFSKTILASYLAILTSMVGTPTALEAIPMKRLYLMVNPAEKTVRI